MGIGWRSNEGSDSLPNLSRGDYLGAHGSNKSNIQVVYHAQPITTSQQWLPAAPSLKEFSYDGLPIALNGTDRYYNISEFQYGSSSASELFKVTVDNIDYDPTYGESKPRATGPDGSFAANTEIVIQDSVSSLTIYLPTDAAEGIHNNIYYTTDLRNIVNEVNIQRTTAVNILNNREKYEAVVTECDNIFHTIEGMLTPQQQPAPAYKQEEFEAFKTEVAEKLSMQQDILMKIASELGLNKNKDGKQKG